MKRIVSAQDDERAEIGRDLHDEFAPLLFAARANAHALQASGGDAGGGGARDRNLAHRRSHPEDQQPAAGAAAPARSGKSRAGPQHRGTDRQSGGKSGQPRGRLHLDPAIDQLDELSARTVYRFVQEAITNVLRHAKASRAGILATIQGSLVTAEVSDNGVGMAEGTPLGRGLQGMKERIDALGGTFVVDRLRARSCVARCP